MCLMTGHSQCEKGCNMSTAGRCVFTHLLRNPLSPGPLQPAVLTSCAARWLSLTSQLCAKPRRSPDSGDDDEESTSQPIKFSTSQASHRTWKVERSMGSRFQRPWWKVLPVSVFAVGFLLWCAFRRESDVDQALEKQLYEHLPGLLNDEEEEEGTQEREELKKRT